MGDIIGDVSLERVHDHGNVSTDSRCAQNKSCCGTVVHPFGQREATRLLLVIFRTGLLPTHDKVTGSLRSLSSGILAGLHKEVAPAPGGVHLGGPSAVRFSSRYRICSSPPT